MLKDILSISREKNNTTVELLNVFDNIVDNDIDVDSKNELYDDIEK